MELNGISCDQPGKPGLRLEAEDCMNINCEPDRDRQKKT